MPNRLAGEGSPYLVQHAEDPVDWLPWGPEAFDLARDTGLPIFLSIGYASCHWCHVMHRESFSDPEIAALLNGNFVSIKVDREVRPDVDEHYMSYVVASTGSGGWPMSVFLTPELVPIFGGTYYPPESHQGIPSFRQVLEQITHAFEHRPEVVAEASDESRDYLRSMFAPLPEQPLAHAIVEVAAHQLISSVDPRFGGFGNAPKFPQAQLVDFLLAYARATHDTRASVVAEEALEAMVRGGIYDQVGGGLARYATDAAWLVPHFEKMLYDNAQLLSSLARMHQLRPRNEWEHAMRGTAEFLDRDLRLESGAYASSLDADTNGVEGATYVWTYEELAAMLTPEQLALACDRLGVTPGGNWEGSIIITRPDGRLEGRPEDRSGDADEVDDVLAALFALRSKREQPGRDDKAIVSWNALAACGLMEAGEALHDDEIRDRGVSLVRLLIDQAVDDDHRVARLLADTSAIARHDGVLEDAVGLATAALLASRVGGDEALATAARHIFDRARNSFYDGEGTWYLTSAQTELPVRPREQNDGPLASGPSLAARVALDLADLTGDTGYRDTAEATLRRLVPLAERSPFAAGAALEAMLTL